VVRPFITRALALTLWGAPACAQEPAPAAGRAATADSAAVEITFLDVGQGDAILVRSPEGKTALIDAGPRSIVHDLRALGVDTIDLAVATHPHADHIGGMADVLREFSVRYYLDNGIPHTTATYRGLLATLRRSDVIYLEATARTITLGSVSLRILPPPGVGEYGGGATLNNTSVGVLLEYGSFRAILTGDSEVDELNHFLSLGVPHVTVLKAAHHGARNGVTPAWLAATRPEVVVISVGAGNTYGHPDPWALRYYQTVATDVYRTDRDGSVTIVGHGDGAYEVRSARSVTVPRS
jgi:beta-lactamase superfamily II metal-dependent hydrolase